MVMLYKHLQPDEFTNEKKKPQQKQALKPLYSIELLFLAKILCTESSDLRMDHNDYVNKSNHINERNARTWMKTKKHT